MVWLHRLRGDRRARARHGSPAPDPFAREGWSIMRASNPIVRCLLRLTCVVAMAVALGCTPPDPSDGGPGPGDADTNGSGPADTDTTGAADALAAFQNYQLDPAVFSRAVESARLVEFVGTNGDVGHFPLDELLVLLQEDATPEDAAAIATMLGGSIVGQVPSIMLFQIELPTANESDLATARELAATDPRVAAVGYNHAIPFAEMCPALNDNEDNLILSDRCAFEDTEYYQAITMFEFFRPHLRLHEVVVGVVDSGLQADNGEFDNILSEQRLLNLNGPTAPWIETTSDGHGTGVLALIAADDNGSMINGIAERFLHRRLHVAVATIHVAMDGVVGAENAIRAGASIVNLSFTGPFDFYAEAAGEGWGRLMRTHPNVLFIVAAGDGQRRIAGHPPPAGIDLDNVVTVGGTQSCLPTERSLTTNFGPSVDMGAPGLQVPTVPRYGGPNVRFANGTSFAAPQVTALAALLKSLNPRQTPLQIKNRMKWDTFPTSTDIGGSRLTYTISMNSLLFSMNVGDPIESWIDATGLGVSRATGLILSRVCPSGMHFEVDDFGTAAVSPNLSDDHLLAGVVNAGGFNVTGNDGTLNFSLASNLEHEFMFELGAFDIVADPPPGALGALFNSNDPAASGHSLWGTAFFDACEIVERDPFTGAAPFVVHVTGSFSGLLEVVNVGASEVTYNRYDGYFSRVPLSASLFGERDPVIDHLEEICIGGRPLDAPAE
jgi:subtilisin family serine protease